MLCPKCNQSAGENDGFCSHCGYSLAECRQAEQVVNDASAKNRTTDMSEARSYKRKETLQERFFNADGRLNRKPYIIRLLIWHLVALGFELIAIFMGGDVAAVELSGFSPVGWLLGTIITISMIMLMIRRLHDLNRTGWLWLLILVPYINLALLVYVLFFKGTTGPNRFGPDPLK